MLLRYSNSGRLKRRSPFLYNPCDPSSKLLKGVIKGSIYGPIIGVMKEDTRSLDYSSYYGHLTQNS